MNTLLSKLQYKNYETGEYSDSARRSLEETIALIKAYPWVEQCHLVSIGLTAPSVTIEDETGNYLKIGHYYNDKFCLYLFTSNGSYMKKIVLTMDDGLAIVRYFFKGTEISSQFQKENALGVKKHFITNDFIFRVTGRRILRFMWNTIIVTIIFTGFLIAFLRFPPSAILFITPIWIFCCGINWVLFINYYNFSKNLFLKISKGQSQFLFGTEDNHKEYDKKDITSFTVYAPRHASKGPPWFGFEVYEITFSNGEKIKFTSLLISMFTIPDKLGVSSTDVNRFIPFVKQRM